jgi:glycosyltransferase involved in cell wall biosynthesis
MSNIAILGLIDFENWSNTLSVSMGGSSGVIKSILPYLNAEKIYLLGITSDKRKLNQVIKFKQNVFFIATIYTPRNSLLPTRLLAFLYSRSINQVLEKFQIKSIYSHAEEMSYWIDKRKTILYHMHGSSNALSIAKNKLHRNKFFQYLWEKARKANVLKATKIIAIDRKCYDIAKSLKQEKKAIILPNFVDTDIYFPDQSRSKVLKNITSKILLFVGRIEEVKGLELFVETIIELNHRNKGAWTGVIVGSGSYESNIRKYINYKGAQPLLFFTGPVFDQSELRKIYNQSSVLMISSYTEGIPMVILESLACGTPVVSTEVGGIKEFIEDNIMCITSDSRNTQKFAELVVEMSQRKTLQVNNFRYSANKSAEIINEILNG